MKKIRKRKLWLLLLLLAGGGAIWVGKSWLFAEAYCPRLQDAILYLLAAVGTVFGLVWAFLTSNDSPVTQLVSIAGLFVGILVTASVAGSFLSTIPEVQEVYCPSRSCKQAEFARSLREEGRLEAAEQAARDCLEDTPATPNEAVCQDECARELAIALYEKSDPSELPQGWDEKKRHACEDATGRLAEACEVAQQHGYGDLVRSVTERQQRFSEACATPTPIPPPTPIPTPGIEIEVLHAQRTENYALVDVRVLRAGQPLQELQVEDFALSINGQSLQFEFEARKADDPVCLIAVVDNSGSIHPGLEQIRDALEKLNDARKPGDELGLVVFGTHQEVDIWQNPSPDPLDTVGVDASGRMTALWDGVVEGLEAADSCSADNRYLLLLTDGHDTDSQRLGGDSETQAREVARRAREQGVNICTVGVRSEDLEPDPLRLAAYGCGYHSAENFDELASLFTSLFGYVREFYRLRIDPAALPAEGKATLQVRESKEVPVDFASQAP
jgi:Mg-chelatase subunit ChlD